MLCPYCNNFRPVNEGPCPSCGAPSTPVRGAMDNQQAFNGPVQQQQAAFPTPQGFPTYQAGSPMTPAPAPTAQGNHSASLLQRFMHANTTQNTPPQGAGNDNSLWGQVMAPQAAQVPPQIPNYDPAFQQQHSMLPVPYQPGAGWPNQQQQAPQQSLAVLPQGASPAVAPASSDTSLAPLQPQTEEAPIYVAPMYTKPRPIIPRYRAISGLLSVLIVSLLLCTGVGLYAKASGSLSFLRVLYGGETRPKSEAATPVQSLPPPKTVFQPGPASNIITSASTASSIDLKTAVPLIESTTFTLGQTIFLTYSVHPRSPGTVVIKWYTNGLFYESSPAMAITNAKDTNGYTVMQFQQQLTGSVELYWNNQLGIRLYFVVTN